jgi:predicted HTH transcriptional regulator
MLDLKTKADLQRLVDEGLEESITLDYKASPALTRDGKGPDELCKDVSALANSTGGQLIYGIEEDKKTAKPSKVDGGVADPKITREWIEQVLNSKVQPRMDGVRIERVDMQTGKFGYVITVQQSQTGPHQAPDGKYYRRFNLQSVPMHDYEIRDVMRRSTVPNLKLGLSIGPTIRSPRLARHRA